MVKSMTKIFALVRLDFKIEYRNKFEIYGLLLFVVVTSFILYKSIIDTDVLYYNAVFWVLLLVISTNFALRSFTKMNASESRYLYQLTDATSIIFSKLFFNWLLIFTGGLLFLLSGLIFHSFDEYPLLSFFGLLTLSSLALSSTYSLPSALFMSSSSKATLLGILAFPISIPVILISSALGNQLLAQNEMNSSGLLMLVSIALIMIAVSLILFRYTWQS